MELECPSCGAPVKYNAGDIYATCEYCGSKALLNNHQTIHIVDEVKLKEAEIEHTRLKLEQQNQEELKIARKRYNTVKFGVIACGVLGFVLLVEAEGTFFMWLLLLSIFAGIFVLPQMNPDKKGYAEQIGNRVYGNAAREYASTKSRTVTFLLCFFMGGRNSSILRWKDRNGHIVFSDRRFVWLWLGH